MKPYYNQDLIHIHALMSTLGICVIIWRILFREKNAKTAHLETSIEPKLLCSDSIKHYKEDLKFAYHNKIDKNEISQIALPSVEGKLFQLPTCVVKSLFGQAYEVSTTRLVAYQKLKRFQSLYF